MIDIECKRQRDVLFQTTSYALSDYKRIRFWQSVLQPLSSCIYRYAVGHPPHCYALHSRQHELAIYEEFSCHSYSCYAKDRAAGAVGKRSSEACSRHVAVKALHTTLLTSR